MTNGVPLFDTGSCLASRKVDEGEDGNCSEDRHTCSVDLPIAALFRSE